MRKNRAEVPAAVSQYAWTMRVLAVVYALGALLFFFFPNEIFYLINVGPKVFKITEAMPDSVEHFWLVLATSMMAMLSALSLLAAESPRIHGYALVHILSKTVSTAGFVYCFAAGPRYFGYLVGIATDLPLAVLVTVLHVRARGAMT
jgi:hypothetical protein